MVLLQSDLLINEKLVRSGTSLRQQIDVNCVFLVLLHKLSVFYFVVYLIAFDQFFQQFSKIFSVNSFLFSSLISLNFSLFFFDVLHNFGKRDDSVVRVQGFVNGIIFKQFAEILPRKVCFLVFGERRDFGLQNLLIFPYMFLFFINFFIVNHVQIVLEILFPLLFLDDFESVVLVELILTFVPLA